MCVCVFVCEEQEMPTQLERKYVFLHVKER